MRPEEMFPVRELAESQHLIITRDHQGQLTLDAPNFTYAEVVGIAQWLEVFSLAMLEREVEEALEEGEEL